MGKTVLMIAAACALVSVPAAAQVVGPSYPPPGGVTFTPNGVSIYQAGRVGTYSGFDLSQTGDLYFALTEHGLAMDGAINETGETLTYNAGLSNLAGGSVVYTGFTAVNSFGSDQNVFTRLVLNFTDLSNNPLALTYDPSISTTDPLLLVLASYRMSGSFEASSNGTTWSAAGAYYDAIQGKPAGASGLQGSFGGNFYWTPAAVPEPTTWAMMLLGFGGIGMAMRRRPQPKLAQVA